MSNEAAARLYILLAEFIKDERAAERRATVERVRAAVHDKHKDQRNEVIYLGDLAAILDAEAAR